MASLHPASAQAQQAFAGPQPTPLSPHIAPPTSPLPPAAQAVSPPSKQNLRTWWRNFSKGQGKNHDAHGTFPEFLSRPQFHEGPMGSEVPVAEEVQQRLVDRPVRPSKGGSDPRQSPHRRSKSDTPQMSPSGRLSTSSMAPRTGHDSPNVSPFRHKISGFALAFTKLKGSERSLAKVDEKAAEPSGIFGVPLRQSITYANVAISLVDGEGKSYIYGYVPIVVAKCGVYLKEKATNVEGIFRLSGAEKRIKELVVIFNSPDRYGKGLDWDGYTVHDAANVLRRYLNQLPEPIVPLDLYDRFREPLRGHALEAVGDQEASQASEEFDLQQTILKYQQLITELPPLNRQLLLYILDLLAVFASKSDENRMTSQNLAAIFQPGMLSHPAHDMAPAEYRLSQDVLVFLIENQDHFLIGMRGTAADEKTVQDVQNGGTPPLPTPSTPTSNRGKNTIGRSASNASAGAESLRRQGGVRRNVSVNSRHSRQSNGAPSPASPALGSPLTQTPSAGVHRSNTVPSKKSPGLPSNRLQKSLDGRAAGSSAFQSTTATASEVPVAPVIIAADNDTPPEPSSSIQQPTVETPTMGTTPSTPALGAGQSQDRLLLDSSATKPEVTTPTRDRGLFQRSPTAESDRKPQNKLRKKRIPGSSNPSAQSSTNSLPGQSGSASPAFPTTQPNRDIPEHPPLPSIPSGDPAVYRTEVSPIGDQQLDGSKLSAMSLRPDESHRASDGTLKPQNSSQSLRSREESMNEQSDMDPTDDPIVAAERKEKRRRWRLSRRKDDTLGANLASPKKTIGTNGGAETSTTSFGSSRARKSFTADPPPLPPTPSFGPETGMPGPPHHQSSMESTMGPSHESFISGGGTTTSSRDKDGKEEKKGPIDWIKRKIQETKEEKRERDAEKEREKMGKGGGMVMGGMAERRGSGSDAQGQGMRGKSMDVRRSAEKVPEAPAPPAPAPTPATTAADPATAPPPAAPAA